MFEDIDINVIIKRIYNCFFDGIANSIILSTFMKVLSLFLITFSKPF